MVTDTEDEEILMPLIIFLGDSEDKEEDPVKP